MKKLIYFLFTLFSLESSAQKIFQMSDVEFLMVKKEFGSAITLLDKMVDKHPAKDTLYTNRGICYFELKKIQQAYYDLTKAIHFNPNMERAYLYRAKAFISSNETNEAINDLNMAVKLARDDNSLIYALVLRGSARCEIRQFDGSIEDSKTVLAIDSNNIEALNNLGLVFNMLGQNEEGLACLYKINKIDSTLLFVPINIGFVLMSTEQYSEAIEWMNKAIKIDSSQPLAYNNRGYAKFKLGKTQEALSDINKSISLWENNNYAYRNRALVYLEMKEVDKACADMKKSMELGYTEQYGNEIKDLYQTNCSKR